MQDNWKCGCNFHSKIIRSIAVKEKDNYDQVTLTAKLFNEYGTKYAGRKGGYTRIVKIGERRGDGAMKVILELV